MTAWQWASVNNTRSLAGKQLNGIQPSFILLFTTVPFLLRLVKMSLVKKKEALQALSLARWDFQMKRQNALFVSGTTNMNIFWCDSRVVARQLLPELAQITAGKITQFCDVTLLWYKFSKKFRLKHYLDRKRSRVALKKKSRVGKMSWFGLKLVSRWHFIEDLLSPDFLSSLLWIWLIITNALNMTK